MKAQSLLLAMAASLLWGTASAAWWETESAASSSSTNSSISKVASACIDQAGLCLAVSIPPASAAAGDGDIFFQIQAPASYEWAAFGQGQWMAGSSMFIIYADASTNNVTLSPRLGFGEVEPEYYSGDGFELLAGSGIANDTMIANVRCSVCAAWHGGSMSFRDRASSWIWAYKVGRPLATDYPTARLSFHDDYGTMSLDLTQGVGGSADVNPFVLKHDPVTTATSEATASATASSAAPSSAAPSSTAAVSPGSNNGSNTVSSGIGKGVGSSADAASGRHSGTHPTTLRTAHGIIMGAVMLILFPLGVLVRRLIPTLSIGTHAAIQAVALILTVAGAALGIILGTKTGKNGSMHAVIGIIVLILMGFQPLFGIIQHRHFRTYKTRSPFGWGHRVFGAVAMLLGVVNGGLGVQLANMVGTSAGNAYILTAAVLGSLFVATYAATAYAKRVRLRRRMKEAKKEQSRLQMKEQSRLQTEETWERPPPYPDYQSKHPDQEKRPDQWKHPDQGNHPDQWRHPDQGNHPDQWRHPDQGRHPDQWKRPDQWRHPDQGNHPDSLNMF